MGAPFGNQNAVGSPGGGRPSAYREFQNALQHFKSWMNDTDIEKLKKKIGSGKYSVWDMYLWKAIIGDKNVLPKYGDKILPDLKALMGPDGGPVEFDLIGEAKKRSAKYHPAAAVKKKKPAKKKIKKKK